MYCKQAKAEVSITDLDPVGQSRIENYFFQTADNSPFTIGTISTDWRTIKTHFGKTYLAASKQARLERQVPKV